MKSELVFDALRDTVMAMPDDRLTAARHAALANLEEHGLPTTAQEDWKYTDIATLIDASNEWLTHGAEIEPIADGDIESITNQFDAEWLIVRNGIIDSDSVDTLQQSQIDGRLLTETETSVTHDAPLSDLNLALLRDGISIRISARREGSAARTLKPAI